jgi:hypothetical protein
MTSYTFNDDDLSDVNRLVVDALRVLDHMTSYEFEKRSRGQVLADSIASAQRMVAYCNECAFNAHDQSEVDEWSARAWEYRLELETLKNIEVMTSFVESASQARRKADASWRDALAVNQ